jgi:alpha-tubulin suppressor-like RCC1 family protein
MDNNITTKSLYMFGLTFYDETSEQKETLSKPILMKSFENMKIDEIKCGSDYTKIISNNKTHTIGRDQNWVGEMGHSIFIDTYLSDTITEICHGRKCFVVLKDKQLFTLNFVDCKEIISGNKTISDGLIHERFFADKNVTKISCGLFHIAVVADWQLYIIEEGMKSKKDNSGYDILLTRHITEFKNMYITMVSCGGYHTAVLVGDVFHDNMLYIFGDNRFGTLGDGSNYDVKKPQRIEIFKYMRVKMVSCGLHHTAVVADDKLYTFGSGFHGALGHGSWIDHNVPRQVECLRDVVYVKCGPCHTVVIAGVTI